eukprot:1193145-Prorocentrum_minimum.AAC.2
MSAQVAGGEASLHDGLKAARHLAALTVRADPSANEAAAEGLRRALRWAAERLPSAVGSARADGSHGPGGVGGLPHVPEEFYEQMVRANSPPTCDQMYKCMTKCTSKHGAPECRLKVSLHLSKRLRAKGSVRFKYATRPMAENALSLHVLQGLTLLLRGLTLTLTSRGL